MPNYLQLKIDCQSIQYSQIISEELKTNLVADEIYKYCKRCVKELETISEVSKTLNDKVNLQNEFIENFLGVLEPEFIILESSINQ